MAKANRTTKKQNRNLAILTPQDVEKWAVFSSKMQCAATRPSACKRDHRVTRVILSQIPGIDVKGTIASFKKLGGYCDCEVVMNAMRLLESDYFGVNDVEYFEKVVGEEFDPDSPTWKEIFAPLTCVCDDCHAKLEAEERAAKKFAA